ncbi:MAG: nitrile hydratase subunit beta [Gammaproteobacteria bacterium]|nr:nitrile hydratase subunit beta [Gammaproteobacteria bacterium]MCY4275650.1 nitrile hydratase subunit beta [Gammaproteobacteria bacterium]
MNSTHDLGGTHGHGPIDRSPLVDFLNDLERKIFGMTLACGMLGAWNLDESRHARETMKPGDYLNSSYYEHWLHGLEQLLLSKGLISEQELNSGNPMTRSAKKAVSVDQIPSILSKGAPTSLKTDEVPYFQVGQMVLVRNFNPKSHTRAPRYIRGRKGVVINHHGAHIFADQHAKTGEKVPMHLYSVRFEAEEVWGTEDAESRVVLYLDLFESYLDAVQ